MISDKENVCGGCDATRNIAAPARKELPRMHVCHVHSFVEMGAFKHSGRKEIESPS